jgi:hypothetical protein
MAAAQAVAVLAACAALLISANVLTCLGVPYTAEGGPAALKLHPATILCCLAAVTKLASSGRSLFATVAVPPLLLGFLCAWAVCLALEALMTGAGNLIVLLDTYLPAGLLAFVCWNATSLQQTCLRTALQCCFAWNIVLGLVEGVSHSTLVPPAPDDPPSLMSGADFRPMALYDHPLTGAAMTLIAAFVPPDRSRRWLHWIYYGLVGLGLVEFGGRAAMAAGALSLCWFGACSARRAVLRRTLPLRVMVLIPVAACFGLAVSLAISVSGLGERLERHFYWDSSAQVRLDQWHVLGLLDTQQLIFGAARQDVLALLEKLRLAYGVPVIENFWLLMFLSLGLLGFPIFLAGLGCLLVWCARQGGGRGLPMVLAVLAAASTSNSLGRKSTLLLVLVAAAASMRRPARRRSPAPDSAGRRLPQTSLPMPAS